MIRSRSLMSICLILIVLVVSACRIILPFSSGEDTAIASPTTMPATEASIPPTPAQVLDTPTPAKVTPSPSEPVLFPTPVAAMQDLSLYGAVLRPEFAGEVEAVSNAAHYFIQASLIPGDDPRLVGVERVRYTNTETVPLDDLYFRLYPNLPGYDGLMTVERVMLNDTPVVGAELEAENSALRVPLDPTLTPGQAADLTLWFDVDVPTDTSAGYAVFAFADDVYALAGFYPTIPTYDDEGWNVEVPPDYADPTFTDVAFYQVHLTVPADLTVVTSGSTLETKENGDGTRTWIAAAGPVRDFYVAMSADYRVVSQEVDGTQVNSYYRSAQVAGGELALQYATESLHLYNEWFGPYPYAELDVVATPTNAGGVEYPGAIVIAQRLYDETGGFFELATVHEVAHQWWYGLVGNDQLDEPWLDESLTNYSAYLYYEGAYEGDQADRIKAQVFEGAYEAVQKEGLDRGIAGPVASFTEPEYGSIVYGKGPLFFDAVRAQLGDEAFFTALQGYLKAHRYGVAYPEDLIAAFEETSGQQIDDLVRFWLLGQTGE